MKRSKHKNFKNCRLQGITIHTDTVIALRLRKGQASGGKLHQTYSARWEQGKVFNLKDLKKMKYKARSESAR